jgi:hypothetical protein
MESVLDKVVERAVGLGSGDAVGYEPSEGLILLEPSLGLEPKDAIHGKRWSCRGKLIVQSLLKIDHLLAARSEL